MAKREIGFASICEVVLLTLPYIYTYTPTKTPYNYIKKGGGKQKFSQLGKRSIFILNKNDALMLQMCSTLKW